LLETLASSLREIIQAYPEQLKSTENIVLLPIVTVTPEINTLGQYNIAAEQIQADQSSKRKFLW
jgi:hypothetical protein